jgi:DNA-binding LacI/PurR family transcriptional regulator
MLADSLSYSFSDPVANQLLQGISEVLVEKNKQLLLFSSHADSAAQSSAESLPDGFILYGAPKGNTLERLLRANKPLIAVDFESDLPGSVNIDNEQGAYSVAKHLLSESRSNVAVLGLRLIDSPRVCRLTAQDLRNESVEISRNRLAGYMRAAEEKGLNIAPEQIWHIPLNATDSAEIAAREALTVSPLPEVLLCMSDVIALAAVRVAKELDIRIPQDISIAGFDDIPEASRSAPPLTTVCQQSLEKGRAAARMLFEGVKEEKLILETRLVLRGSSI